MTKINARNLSQEEIRRLFRYDAGTGVLIWRERPRSDFKNEQATGAWNTKFAGTVAGCVRKDGYRVIEISGRKYLAHRLNWIFHNGPISEGMMIDHIDNDPSDNRISNLRLATHAENNRNKGAYSNSATGIKGVSYKRDIRKYRAVISVNGRDIHLGIGTIEECSALYAEAANRYHGDFARIA